MSKPSLISLLLGVSLALPAMASAADFTAEPRVNMRVEYNDNLTLEPITTSESEDYGYMAELDYLVGIASPRGETSLRPRVRLQQYPDREDSENFEGFLDVLSRYEWQRSVFQFNGNFAYQDLLNSDTSGGFDPLDPDGGSPDGGGTTIGQTRTTIGVRPTYEHRLSERMTLGASADFLATRYDADEGPSSRTDYDYGVLDGYLAWALSAQSSVSAGMYASRYESTDELQKTDAIGGRLGYTYQWSETDGIEATINYERNDTDTFLPVLFEESSSDIGGTLTAYRVLEVSEWRISVGRWFIPSGENGKSITDRFRLQYDRQLSPRLTFRGEGRYETRTGISELNQGNDRDFARGDLSLKWMITEKWYIGGGYSYLWEEREQAVGDADNNRLFINFGYQGLSEASLGDRP